LIQRSSPEGERQLYVFSQELFASALRQVKEYGGEQDRLFELIGKIQRGENLDYDSFTYDEISTIFEHARDYDQAPANLFARYFSPALIAEKLISLPRRREGRVFV
jgi:hypothetical protein